MDSECGTGCAKMNDMRRLHNYLDVATCLPGRGEVLLPEEFSKRGIDRIQGIRVSPEHDIFESPGGDHAGRGQGFAEPVSLQSGCRVSASTVI